MNLVLGTQTNDSSKLISLSPQGMLHHTLVVGQSGSGKSFFVARLLEELIARTRARLVIIDPNGDFARFDEPTSAHPVASVERLRAIAALCRSMGIATIDDPEDF